MLYQQINFRLNLPQQIIKLIVPVTEFYDPWCNKGRSVQKEEGPIFSQYGPDQQA